VTQWILGLRPDHDGLRVDPCLPSGWDGYRATRRFRGATYDIAVRAPAGGRGRVGHLVVDGHRVAGNLVPLAPAGTHVTVEAEVETDAP
jgi:cellobiose phosphorylase